MATNDTVVTTLKLPKALYVALKEVADADERSVASTARIAIKRYVESSGVSVNSVKEAPKLAPLTPERTRTIAEEWGDEDDD